MEFDKMNVSLKLKRLKIIPKINPNISKHILHTIHHKFPEMLTRRIC